MTKWGIVATVKASARDILRFAAYHIDQGAHRLFLYLDAPNPEVMPYLQSHPKIRVIETDEAYWIKRQNRVPKKHQVRQSLNANRAYRRQAKELDWLIHIDVDEFLTSETPIAAHLARLDPSVFCARVRPLEALASPQLGAEMAFKARIPKGIESAHISSRLYPSYGRYLKGGFISHIQGKLFVRTGRENVAMRIHNAIVDKVENPDQTELAQIDLCHLHARSWEQWLAHYRYRLEQGSYRESMSPAVPIERGGVTLNTLLASLEAEHGEAGLRAFFDEVSADTDAHRQALAAEGLLRLRHLPFEALVQKHFANAA